MKIKTTTAPRIIRPTFSIGIDPGVDTGFSQIVIKPRQTLISVVSLPIHGAMVGLAVGLDHGGVFNMDTVHVRVEDARLRRWFGTTGAERWKGAGSIMRDCTIWEDFLLDLQQQHPNLTFEMVPPAHNKTKLSADAFRKLTGWAGRTNEHARDAAMLIWGRESFNLK